MKRNPKVNLDDLAYYAFRGRRYNPSKIKLRDACFAKDQRTKEFLESILLRAPVETEKDWLERKAEQWNITAKRACELWGDP